MSVVNAVLSSFNKFPSMKFRYNNSPISNWSITFNAASTWRKTSLTILFRRSSPISRSSTFDKTAISKFRRFMSVRLKNWPRLWIRPLFRRPNGWSFPLSLGWRTLRLFISIWNKNCWFDLVNICLCKVLVLQYKKQDNIFCMNRKLSPWMVEIKLNPLIWRGEYESTNHVQETDLRSFLDSKRWISGKRHKKYFFKNLKHATKRKCIVYKV